jgi:hypothetical protein
MVDGTAITASQFDQQLEALAGSPGYVKDFNTSQLNEYEQEITQAQEQGQSTSGVQLITLQGTSTGPENYSLEWAVIQLNRVINGTVLSQYLAGRHMAPTAAQLVTAWDAEYAAAPVAWREYTPALRATLAREDADHALIETKLTSASEDKQFYDKSKSFFWSRVCVSSVNVSVPGPGGGIDEAASRAQATKLAAEAGTGGTTAGGGGQGLASGAQYCLTPEQLVEKPSAYAQGVFDLAVGHAIAVAGPDGYQVVMVRSRALVPFSTATEAVVDVVAGLGGSEGTGYNDTPLIKILKKAHVAVEPEYGAWDGHPPSPYAPQDLAPRQLLTS